MPARTKRKPTTGLARLLRFEHRGEPLLARHLFAARIALAVALALALAMAGLTIGMIGYRYFEGMSFTNAFVNAAMILSGMGVFDALKTQGGKIFAGCYALLCGLGILIAAGFILAPVFHRILHIMHLEERGEPE